MTRLLSFLALTFFASVSSANPKCDYQELGFSFGGSETIPYLKLALKYQDFDFSTIENVFDMQQVLKEKNIIEDIYKAYKKSPFIWGETYKEMYPFCSESQKDTLFAKAFTVYESRWKQINSFNIDEQMEMVEYINTFDSLNRKESKVFGIKSYEHFMSIFSSAIQNIEDNRINMSNTVKGERENTKREIAELNEKKREIERQVAAQKAANEEKRRLQASIKEQQQLLKDLNAENASIGARKNDTTINRSQNIGNRTIQRNSIVCYSEAAFDRQMGALAQEDNRLFAGCTITERATKAWFDDISMFSGTCTLLNSDRSRKLWVNCENVD